MTNYQNRMIDRDRPDTMTYLEITMKHGIPEWKSRYLLKTGVLEEVPALGRLIRISKSSVDAYVKRIDRV